jgi:hypothetical protein
MRCLKAFAALLAVLPVPAAELRAETLLPANSRFAIELTASGGIAGFSFGKGRPALDLNAFTKMAGCESNGAIARKKLESGGVEFVRTLVDPAGHVCALTDRFMPTKDSIRWEIEITGDGPAWTTPIETRLDYPAGRATRFWTAWSDPEHKDGGWRDPLNLRPFEDARWDYSNLSYIAPERGDFIALPLVSILEPSADDALSLVLSPEDTILEMSLDSTRSGTVRFTRTNLRLGGGRTVRLAMDLTVHEADWRGGLRWLAARYPEFFNPPNPLADQMAGCGAYSGCEDPVDADRLRRMAFRINWKLSDDFAWMGMFLPPLAKPDDTWERACDEPAPPGKPRTTSFRRMNDYAAWMRRQGFFVLSYFNVTELGRKMEDRPVPAGRVADPGLWKDPVAYCRLLLPGAHLNPRLKTFYGAWASDCGDPDYERFLLEQAERHIKMLPAASGICIDRLDWLRQYNRQADDGVSWVDGGPVRSLYTSWKNLMARLGPLMHAANKVIFVNPMTLRLDLLKEVDGIYSEHGEAGPGLNSIALVSLRKTALTWTCMWWDRPVSELKPDPDSFFQRHLLMGVYPTAPYPFNNHALRPDPATDRHYLDYGPLLDALRGKKWVLEPHCVETDTPDVKVNLFQTPEGFVVPVMFGGRKESARIRIRNIPGLDAARCEAVTPGSAKREPLTLNRESGAIGLTVPLKRGCAMVLIR